MMKRNIEQVRRDIAKRKQQKKVVQKHQRPNYSNLLPQDEEKHGYLPTASYSVKTSEEKESVSVAPTFVLKTILAAILFFAVAITVQWEASWLEKPKAWTTAALTEDFPFATVNVWYQDRFGSPFSLMPESGTEVTSETMALPVNGSISQPFHTNGKGVWIDAHDQSDVHAVDQGTIIFAGNDRETNKTVIIQHPDRSKTIYGNLSEINVNPYQFVQANQVIAKFEPTETNNGGIYFALQHNNEYIDPVQVIKVDEGS